jgi:hypothetical protein
MNPLLTSKLLVQAALFGESACSISRSTALAASCQLFRGTVRILSFIYVENFQVPASTP